jgi:hypothetical protein
MVIPNTSLAECGFEMFNKQPAGYLYHILPKFDASDLFIKSLLRRSVAAKVEHSGGVETSCPVKLKTCGFKTTKTTSAS